MLLELRERIYIAVDSVNLPMLAGWINIDWKLVPWLMDSTLNPCRGT